MHTVTAKGILSHDNGMNLYRGCTHGCIYCDSRSKCYRMDHDFEDIEVKENALALLEAALRRKRRRCMIGTGAMTDPYIPPEMKLEQTRGALLLIERYGFGVALQTKSDRVLRDLDILRRINDKTKEVVQMTLTTADEALCRIIEPRVSTTRERVAALRTRGKQGILLQAAGRAFSGPEGTLYARLRRQLCGQQSARRAADAAVSPLLRGKRYAARRERYFRVSASI